MNVFATLERALAEGADRPAVVEEGKEWTYRALHRHVAGLAAMLRVEGIGPGDRVSVLAPNGRGFLAAYFAAAGIGAVLNPLNTRLAPDELAFILEDAGSRLLMVDRRCAVDVAEVAKRRPTPVRYLDKLDAIDVPAPFRTPTLEPTLGGADDLAHLYYTSGTTGRPKGVMLTHRNVCVHADAAAAELGLTSTDRWAHVAPMFHLADAWASFAITQVGGVHVMQPRFEPASTLRLFADERVTLTNLVPTMLNSMVKHPDAMRHDRSSLRLILSGGAPIAPALVRRVIEVFGCEYVQTYGMTETSPYLTMSLLHAHLRGLPAEEALRYRARTGRPFRGVELEVVDDAECPVPADDTTVGEIRVRGASVSPGYWQRPEETAAVFRNGWLYTGDLAVIDAEGYVDIVDRRKDMVVTGGENVYSIEVENVLYEHPAVLEAAVFGVPHEEWGEEVRAAVVLRPGAEATTDELIAHCRERIAAYKAPRAITYLDELPKTGTGKIEKRTLRDGKHFP